MPHVRRPGRCLWLLAVTLAILWPALQWSSVSAAPPTWTPTANTMSVARYLHASATLADGRILVAGGYDGRCTSPAALYDPQTDSWEAAPPMISGRYRPIAAVFSGGRVLLAGGYTTGKLGVYLNLGGRAAR